MGLEAKKGHELLFAGSFHNYEDRAWLLKVFETNSFKVGFVD